MNRDLSPTCVAIIVTHNSTPYLAKCLSALQQQSHPPDAIVVVDSGSKEKEYLLCYLKDPNVTVHFEKQNVGFCQGNNIGFSKIPFPSDYILFINPDAFLSPLFLEKAIGHLENPLFKKVGALSGALLGYDIQKDQPTGKVDSMGIFQSWQGRWYDRHQGFPYQEEEWTKEPEEIPALCGALMLCRKKALDSVLLGPNEVFDSSFYMYKEDIDRSLRLKKKNWSLLFLPDLIAYHCRGWNSNRALIPKYLRLLSARNEMHLHQRHYSPYFFYSLLKYLSVKFLNI